MGFELLTKDEIVELFRRNVSENEEIDLTVDALKAREQRCREEYEESCKRAKELYDWFVELCKTYGRYNRRSDGSAEWHFPPEVFTRNEQKIRGLQKAQKERQLLFEKWMEASKQWQRYLTSTTLSRFCWNKE